MANGFTMDGSYGVRADNDLADNDQATGLRIYQPILAHHA